MDKHYKEWTDVPEVNTSGPAGTPPLTPEKDIAKDGNNHDTTEEESNNDKPE